MTGAGAHLELLNEIKSAWEVASPLFRTLAVAGATFGGVAGFFKFYNSVAEFWRTRKNAKLTAELNAASGIAAFTEEDFARASENYIEPNCTQIDPSGEDDVRAVIALAPLFETIDQHLALGGDNRHIILLADSGMGKTSFCINFYAREQKKKRRRRKKIAIVPLGRPDSAGAIKEISDKRDTILFLDAFDESANAAGNEHGYLRELMATASDFRNVIVTCRSQFFSSDQAIPRGAGIFYAGARKAGVGREFSLHKLFLAPLSKQQIDQYVRRHFPYPGGWAARSTCRQLVATIPELSVRPMLLELLPDLVREGKTIHQLYGLYGFLIDQWLRRERDWIEETELRNISVELAVILYCRQSAGGGDRIQPAELDLLASNYQKPLESWKLKSRSLLNRDIEGNYKFAHRSIMEFLFVTAALTGDLRCFSVPWSDMAKDLLVSLGTAPSEDAEEHELVLRMIDRDLSKTRIFPLASPLRGPTVRSITECKAVLKAPPVSNRQSRRIPVVWRNASYEVSSFGASSALGGFRIHDSVHDITWRVIDFGPESSEEDRRLYRSEVTFSPDRGKQSPWRIEREVGLRDPSIEEVLTLVESESYLHANYDGLRPFLPNELYWLGDVISGALLFSLGEEVIEGEHLRLLGSRAIGERRFHLYELIAPYGMVSRRPFEALHAFIEDPDVLEFVQWQKDHTVWVERKL